MNYFHSQFLTRLLDILLLLLLEVSRSNIYRLLNKLQLFGGTRGVMVIVVGNGPGDTSSNPGRY